MQVESPQTAFRPHFESLINSLSHRRPAPWPDPAGFEAFFLQEADRHDLFPFIHYYLKRSGGFESWPEEVLFALQREAARLAFWESQRKDELQKLLAAFTKAGLPILILKGAALAYSHYPEPHLRPRADTDLWIEESSQQKSFQLLAAAGYARENMVEGELVSHQAMWTKKDLTGELHVVDLHWKISNPYIFSEFLTFHEALDHSVSIPALSENARGLSESHALLYACVHQAAHHNEQDFFFWSYDMNLLHQKMDSSSKRSILNLAAEKKMRALYAAALLKLKQSFQESLLPEEEAWIQNAEKTGEASAEFLSGPSSAAKVFYSDLKHLPWNKRGLLFWEHLFPSKTYMLEKYHFKNSRLLPFYYLRRIIEGIFKFLRRCR